jgi:hypothetical protein
MYLLGKDKDKQKTHFSFADFFPMENLANEHVGLDIISMQTFLQTTAGQLRNKYNGQIEYPPDNNRTEWDGIEWTPLKEWLRNVTHTPIWSPGECLAAFPASSGTVDTLHAIQAQIHAQGGPLMNFELDNPPPVDASPLERMRENLARRTKLCVYDREMQKQPIVHFMCSHKLRVRLLVRGDARVVDLFLSVILYSSPRFRFIF